MASPMYPCRIALERTSTQMVGAETLIYDEVHHKAWCLNASSACIWRLCSGDKTVQQIAAAAAAELDAPVTEEIVLVTLAELREKELLEPESAPHLPEEITRRQMMGRAGLAAAALLPVIASVLAPAAHAAGGSLDGMSRRAGSISNSLK
ncbi:MAG TPA: PqqD family protein [Acidobacteriaceae bacterium]|nr:PqqD family protein [Acidobacteriaceae bacterium]